MATGYLLIVDEGFSCGGGSECGMCVVVFVFISLDVSCDELHLCQYW